MDHAKKKALTSWAQAAIATCGPILITEMAGELTLSFTGEPVSVTLEGLGATKLSIETEEQFQMILAALMYERGRILMCAADGLMAKSKTAKE
jgi:hypothetical protein